MKNKLLLTILACGTLTSCGCFQEKPTPTKTIVTTKVIRENNIHGTVTQPWAETMNDTIKVPGQIDPTNTYYRAPHQTVVEIRPGKYSETKFDNEKK